MKDRSLFTATILAGAGAAMLFASIAVAQQRNAQPATPAKAKPYVVPKTVDGHPDLQGYWTNATYTPLERSAANANKEFYTLDEYQKVLKTRASGEEEQTVPGTSADVHYDFTQFGLDTGQSEVPLNLRTSLIIDPPDGKLPRLNAGGGGGRGGGGAGRGAAAAGGGGRGGQYDAVQNMPIGSRCIVAGGAGPPLMDAGYNAAYQIVQNKDHVMILTEMIHDVRIIPLDNRPLPPAELKQWIGLSRGRWEGNTLVVETTNFNGRRPFQGAGQNLRVVERFTRTAEDMIDYQFTIYDETVFSRPWTASVPLGKMKGPIFEFACHETNYGVANILAGARKEERDAAEAAAKK
jgi:hypothetical protein